MELTGLTEAEVKQRLKDGRCNRGQEAKTKSKGQIIREHTLTLFNLLNLFLALAVVSVGSYKNITFMIIVAINTIIGIVQELRSKEMVDQLSIMVETKQEVVREGRLKRIHIENIVLGDLLHIKRGSQIPVDCRIVLGVVDMNESLITGEADTIIKKEGQELYSGSFVSGGDCYAEVIRVGKDSFASKLSQEAKVVQPPQSEIMWTLNRIITIITIVLIPLGIILYRNQLTLEGATTKSAVIATTAALVSMIPEGLMLLTSTVLAVSVVRLGKAHVLVQNLYCIETLARVDVLCLDKTGTITSGRMKAEKILYFDKATGKETLEAFRALMKVSRDESPTVEAIKTYVGTESSLEPLQIVDFTSEKKWSGARFANGVTYVMGAGEMILGDRFAQYEALYKDQIGSDRVLLIARSDQSFGPDKSLPDQIRPLGVILIADEIRSKVEETLAYFKKQGVELKVISGDGVETVQAIAQKVGIQGAEKAVDARQLTTPDQLHEAANQYTVFGRVTPQQKRELLKGLKAEGHTVCMTGDGVNDVLAMKESDCSVAMASGSDAARSIAQLVLTTDDFNSMPKVVAEGRRTINNIQRSASLFLTKTIYAMITGLVFAFISLKYPFEPIQMSFISGLTIGFPSFILALEPNEEKVSGNFFFNIITRALSGGLMMAAGVFLSYAFARVSGLTEQELSTLAMVAVTVPEVCLLIRISIPFDPIRGALLGCVIGGLLLGSCLFSSLLSLAELSWHLLGLMLAVTLISAIVFNILYTAIEKWRDKVAQKHLALGDDPKKKRRRDSLTVEAYIVIGIRKAAAWIKEKSKKVKSRIRERKKS